MYVIYILFQSDSRGFGAPYTLTDTPIPYDYSSIPDAYGRIRTSIFMVPGSVDPMED